MRLFNFARATGLVGSSPSSKIFEGDVGASSLRVMGWIKSSTNVIRFGFFLTAFFT